MEDLKFVRGQQQPLNTELKKMIESGHRKELETVNKMIGHGLMIQLLTDYLSNQPEREMHHVLNVIVRETKLKASKK